MPPKKGRKGKEDLERQLKEEDERLAAEELAIMEREAEDKMKLECQARDTLEQKEIKRLRKEHAATVLAEKEKCILLLSSQVNEQVRLFAHDRAELEDEIRELGKYKDDLENQLATLKVESKSTISELQTENTAVKRELADQARSMAGLTGEKDTLTVELDSRTATLRREVTKLEEEIAEKDTKYTEREKDMSAKISNLDRELEKTAALNRTLQEVIENREADDKKNVMLMQLLNNQLDENKKRSQQSLNAEKERCRALEDRVAQLELNQTSLTEESVTLKQDKEQMLRRMERELLDAKQKLEQVKFDARFVHHELSKYKAKLEQQQNDFGKKSKDATELGDKMKTDLDVAQQKIEDLEAAIRKKDRDHFDKVTFLNAQISNNRTIISQLQLKFQKEKESRLLEVAALNDELSKKDQRLSVTQNDLDKKKHASGEVEAKLSSDVAILKTTVFQLQSALVEKERDFENMVADKDDEMRRLRKKLDEHFIPHRRDVEGTESQSKPLEQALSEKVQGLTRDLEIKARVALDTETRLNAQIASTNQVVEALQMEIKAKDDQYAETVKVLSAENSRLKATMEETFVPNPNGV
eukprot:TRINITY_DN16521_c0_g2_i1.p1 TRINITY_DN16521_c0_g2~~TRINITY_DN16521_c0_g2_i1.p1  ORF type:complete len:587 (+),score=340.66 TRINITY_DN16521_c0_g2_i1:95-1855(+)